jgi:hypothetical protein
MIVPPANLLFGVVLVITIGQNCAGEIGFDQNGHTQIRLTQ